MGQKPNEINKWNVEAKGGFLEEGIYRSGYSRTVCADD